jgi:DNA repair protein RecN (Recombination protein N)
LKDITDEFENQIETIENDPEKLAATQDRLNLFYKLIQKHQVKTVSELLSIQDSLRQKVNKNLNLDSEINDLQQETAIKL